MSPNIPSARKKLSYPLYGADFDPLNHDFLIVGGGGGSTSSGVPNKLSLLDASRRTELNEIVDIELAKDEDSVTSLAVASSSDSSLIAYAGINSSVKDQNAGKNEHFRSFKISLPAKKRKADIGEKTEAGPSSASLRTYALGRTALFQAALGPKSDAYQRVLRMAPPHEHGGTRIAAVASGLASRNEIITFKATDSVDRQRVISRVNLESQEAEDLDFVAVEDEKKSHVLAYVAGQDVFLQRILSAGQETKEPIKVHTNVQTGKGSKIRALRWLTPRYILILRNRGGRSGADVSVLKTDSDYTRAQIILVNLLSKSTKQAVGLDVCTLSASQSGDQQIVVAVAGQDSSIEIQTIDYSSTSGMQKFKDYAHFRDVHAGPITRITFSRFLAPTLPVTKDTKPQYIKLASVGVDQTVVVATLPLKPYPATQSRPRYVLNSSPEILQNAINISVALLVVALTAFFMQVFCEIRGAVPPFLNATSWLSPSWQDRIARPYQFAMIDTPVIPESMPPFVETATSSLSSTLESATDMVQSAVDAAADGGNSLIHHLVNSPDTMHKAIVIHDTSDPDSPDKPSELSTEIHDHDSEDLKAKAVKKWEDLTAKEKISWKKKLKSAGHWTEQQGETILKGILFSELAGAVGAAIRG